jgi:hypothetical protein
MVVDNFDIQPVILNPRYDISQVFLRIDRIITDQSAANDTGLPHILVIQLSCGDIKLSVKPGKQGFYPASFFFQGLAPWKIDLQFQVANRRASHDQFLNVFDAARP